MISAPGVGSSLDVNAIVTQLIAAESRPLTLLQNRENTFQARLSAFGTLKGSLSALQSAATTLGKADTFGAVKATVADTSLFTASVGSGAVAGSHDVEVVQLARAHKLVSAGFADSAATVGTGSLTVTFGTFSGGAFTQNPDRSPVTITVTDGSLAGVRDAINSAAAGVSATLVDDGTSTRLVLSSSQSGAANALRISVADNDGNNGDAAGLSQLAFDAAGGPSQLTQAVAAQDAVVRVDTITITRPGNVISGAIEGVTLTLTRGNPGVSTVLSLERDTDAVKTAVEAFVKAFNDTTGLLRDLSAFNADTREAGILNGDSVARSVESQLRAVFNTPVAGAPAGLSVLSDAGISFQVDGSLAIDSAKLQTVLDDPARDLSALFAGDSGFATQIAALTGSLLGADGLLESRTDSINSSLGALDKQREAINARLAQVEARLRSQFAALDALIAGLNQTSSFLQQQLANLPTIS